MQSCRLSFIQVYIYIQIKIKQLHRSLFYHTTCLSAYLPRTRTTHYLDQCHAEADIKFLCFQPSSIAPSFSTNVYLSE